jgi:hypothetical protein
MGKPAEAVRPRAMEEEKGITRVRFANGLIAQAEVHWYEAHGIGRRKMKIKRFWIIP